MGLFSGKILEFGLYFLRPYSDAWQSDSLMSMQTRKEIWSLEFHAVILPFIFIYVQNKDIYILKKKHKNQQISS